MEKEDRYELEKIKKYQKEEDSKINMYVAIALSVVDIIAIIINTNYNKNDMIKSAINALLYIFGGVNVLRSIVLGSKTVKSNRKAKKLEKIIK